MPTIQQVRALSQSARSVLWDILIPAIPGASGQVAENLSLRSRGASFPGQSITPLESWFKGMPIVHPSRRQTPRRISFRFEEGMDLTILNAMNSWMNFFRREDTGVGSGEDGLKVDLQVRLLDYEDTVLGRGIIKAAFPTDVPDVPLEYNSDDLLHFNITFAYSYWLLQ